MPIKHAALKQIRKDRVRQLRNNSLRAELKTLTKRLLGLLKAQKVDEAKALINTVTRRYDKAASQRVIHRKTAARSKSRLMKRLNALKPAK